MDSGKTTFEGGVGRHRPDDLRQPSFSRVDPVIIERLRQLPSPASDISDILDELGWATCVPGNRLAHRCGPKSMIGQAVTMAYLPERNTRDTTSHGHLAHHVVAALSRPGDVLVVSTSGKPEAAVLGGQGALAIAAAGMAGVVVDGSIRDVGEILATEIGVWSASVSPRSGVGRLEAVSINRPVDCGAVQVHPGDLVVADSSGISFIPVEVIPVVVARLLENRQA